MFYAKIVLAVFSFCSLMLFISIVQAIITEPGRIPENKEWDMVTEGEDSDEEKERKAFIRE